MEKLESIGRFTIQFRVIDRGIKNLDDGFRLLNAIECARTGGHEATVDMSWRWLAYDLGELYYQKPGEGAALYSYLHGWADCKISMLAGGGFVD